MIEVLRKDYWSKSEAFLVPLTGLSKSKKYPPKSYLFWENYSIENFQLILLYEYEDYDDFIKHCRRTIFPVLDKSGYLTEVFDDKKKCLFVLDLSEWSFDIEMFLKGKYSKLSKDARDTIEEYHVYYNSKKDPIMAPEILAAIDPTAVHTVYGNKSALEYVAEQYDLNLAELTKLGELADAYNKKEETLSDFDILARKE